MKMLVAQNPIAVVLLGHSCVLYGAPCGWLVGSAVPSGALSQAHPQIGPLAHTAAGGSERKRAGRCYYLLLPLPLQQRCVGLS